MVPLVRTVLRGVLYLGSYKIIAEIDVCHKICKKIIDGLMCAIRLIKIIADLMCAMRFVKNYC